MGVEMRGFCIELGRGDLRHPWTAPSNWSRCSVPSALAFGKIGQGPILEASRSTAWRWVSSALERAQGLGAIPEGRKVGTHTLRHSAARHWLASGIPINVVSRWLGHASLQTTLVYLEVLPDPLGEMDRVP